MNGGLAYSYHPVKTVDRRSVFERFDLTNWRYSTAERGHKRGPRSIEPRGELSSKTRLSLSPPRGSFHDPTDGFTRSTLIVEPLWEGDVYRKVLVIVRILISLVLGDRFLNRFKKRSGFPLISILSF